jgi:hypothetical protein
MGCFSSNNCVSIWTDERPMDATAAFYCRVQCQTAVVWLSAQFSPDPFVTESNNTHSPNFFDGMRYLTVAAIFLLYKAAEMLMKINSRDSSELHYARVIYPAI